MGNDNSAERKSVTPWNEKWQPKKTQENIFGDILKRSCAKAIELDITKRDIYVESLRQDLQVPLNAILARSDKMLEQIWQHYDKNQDGILDEKELYTLVSHFLDSLNKELPGFFKESMATMIDVSAAKIGDPEQQAQFKEFMQKMEKNVRKEAMKLLAQLCYSKKEVADLIFRRLDANRDRKIQKSEFLQRFNGAIKSVISSCFSMDALLVRVATKKKF